MFSSLKSGGLAAAGCSFFCTVLFASPEPSNVHDRGAAGAWQKLLKLPTRARLLHVTAHPDDEHGGMLTRLSRGEGVRVALASLTRGEAGANAIGPELFDELGLVRAEELAAAGRYYGLDALYFTRLADYGYSKSLDEALRSWDRERALEDLVYIIRRERPVVVVSRFQGNERDGHGQHQFAGMLSREAFEAAGDPDRFPHQLREGLPAFAPLKLYLGGFREEEDWEVAVESGSTSPWLGDSYENVARRGLSLQRSQNSGRYNRTADPVVRYYRRVEPPSDGTKEETFFDGIDLSVAAMAHGDISAGEELEAVERLARRAIEGFDWTEPSRIVPLLAEGLERLRGIRETAADPGLEEKKRQFEDAILSSLAIELTATALPPDSELSSSSFASPPVLAPPTPGARFGVEVAVVNRGGRTVELQKTRLVTPPDWRVTGTETEGDELDTGESRVARFRVQANRLAGVQVGNVERDSIAENHYRGDEAWFRAGPPPLVTAEVDLAIEGVSIAAEVSVERFESALPYGHGRQPLVMLPAVSVELAPERGVIPKDAGGRFPVTVSLRNHDGAGSSGELTLELPDGFRAEPVKASFRFERPGETRSFEFQISTDRLEDRVYEWRAVARVGNAQYREGYRTIAHRDLETRYLRRPAVGQLRPVDVRIPDGLTVGYVMGVGDEVPEAIERLGASVELLDEAELAEGELARFDAIVVGTRAYAVRADLRRHNRRLLDYAEGGGNVIVLYNTPEFQPELYAPFPGTLPPRSEEVSEEDAPVDFLEPDTPVLYHPNRITVGDFEGWVEQRGSKFWSDWNARYLPIVASNDRGQSPQQGGWLWARYGEGHYTYFAYALHRQLPFGVPGAFRILANLLALGRSGTASHDP